MNAVSKFSLQMMKLFVFTGLVYSKYCKIILNFTKHEPKLNNHLDERNFTNLGNVVLSWGFL